MDSSLKPPPRSVVRVRGLLVGGVLFLAGVSAGVAQNLCTETPTCFFTNVADRLLRQAFGSPSNSLYYQQFSVTNIPIYPTNGYTPSVHRLLQLAANLYDATTNRNVTPYPHLPSVYRPIFRRDAASTNSAIMIVGYVEETGTRLVDTPPVFVDLQKSTDLTLIRPLGTPIDPNDATEPMVYGVPLVIGAKKGFPNFNEFSMQNAMLVTRRLQFRRQNPADPNSPINETNQMYVVSMTNVFGVEAWNSYSNKFSRDLRMIVATDMSMVITNLPGPAGTILRSNYYSTNAVINIPASTWAGFFHPDYAKASFRIPLSNGIAFMPESRYVHTAPNGFVPLDNVFQQNTGFPVPRWGLILNARLRFILVDVAAQRIVDYVNLSSAEKNTNTVDVTDVMMAGANFGDPVPDANPGGQWNTNRQNGTASIFAPTDGIINQILAGKWQIPGIDWNNFSLDPGAGRTREKAIDGFRKQFDLGPLFYPGGTYYKSNIFYAPLVPFRIIHQPIVWQANDPLVHYTEGDLTDLIHTNVFIDSQPLQPPSNLGAINNRYEPWGGNPAYGSSSPTRYDLAVKDPLVGRSDDWDFPTNQFPNIGWIGCVHRGTPWQTIYLKSASIDFDAWKKWIGNVREDFTLSHPTNDWRLASLLLLLLHTNSSQNLISLNQTSLSAWSGIQNGMVVLTNILTDDEVAMRLFAFPQLPPQFDSVVVQSNSPQAAMVAAAINATRSTQPNGQFHSLGDILATPKLSVASPWLNLTDIQKLGGITDEAYEKIPAQLLPLLRPDSVGAIILSNGQLHIQFTGFDDSAYRVEASPNLLNWMAVSTNYPTNGILNFLDSPSSAAGRRFYRSVLLP